ncbi:hypothetical protein [Rhizobium sophoriradicis]|uniref:hypothetical protein n=1 Tax=Rhizobium sophoriradicis TaxID=1535245 RepID=UPI001FDF33FB|nr:hypothetical protein [Rhizobium sophoriradicis]
MADDEQGAEMQRLAPESALKTGRYDVFAKKDIPASTEPGYVAVIKIRAVVIRRRAPEASRKHAREQKQIAPTLEKGMPFRAASRVRRHNQGRERKYWRGPASIFRACTLFP